MIDPITAPTIADHSAATNNATDTSVSHPNCRHTVGVHLNPVLRRANQYTTGR